jgi:hypothetical protein
MSDPKWIEDARKSFALSRSGLREYSPAEGGRLEKKGKELEAENAVLQDQIKKLMDQSLTIGAENKKLREENGKLEVWNEDATQLYIKLTKTLDKVAGHRSVIRKKLHIATEALEEVKELTGGEYDYYVYNVAEKALNETK